jgi:predicted nuclease of predicted toxin-antitoxin system
MALILADEDFDLDAVKHLRTWGHDVPTVQDVGMKGKDDPLVLAYAIQEGRAVLTFNRRHFIPLHRRVRPHHGIIVCTRDSDAKALAELIHKAIMAITSLDDQLIRITRPPKP